MSNKVKDISIKHHIYYFFVDTINLKKFHLNNIKMKKKKKMEIYTKIYFFTALDMCT